MNLNEDLLRCSYHQMCDHMLVIQKLGDWKHKFSSFGEYAEYRWSLSKTRAKLFTDFAKFCRKVEAEGWKLPDTPDNIQPVLNLPQKRWVEAWELCLAHANGTINKKHCLATLDHYGLIARRKIPPHILKARQVRKAAETMAGFEDGEKLVDDIGPKALGKNWDKAVAVTIDADQARMDRDERTD